MASQFFLRIKFFLLLFLLCGIESALSQDLPAPPYPVRSDYGPRVPPPNGSFFHRGIDYPAAPGNPIFSEETGIVSGLATENLGMQVIRISGQDNRIFGYRHIFSNNRHPIRNTFFELGVNSYFAYERTQIRNVAGMQFEAIIYWTSLADFTANRADKILSPEPNVPGQALIGGVWVNVTDVQGQPIFSRNTVEQGEIIAPVGTSGNFGPHLHLELNFQSGQGDNPFRYVQRPAASAFVVDTSSITGSVFIRREDSESEILTARINYLSGLDLDEVKFYLFPKWLIESSNFEPDFDNFSYLIWKDINFPSGGQTHSAQFLYSGKEGILTPFPYGTGHLQASGTRVVPNEDPLINPDPFGRGIDDFYYESWNSKINKEFTSEAAKDKDANYRDGYQYFYVVADNACQE